MKPKRTFWRSYGGDELLRSYGDAYAADWERLIPAEHWGFLDSSKPWAETDEHIFVHGSVLPEVALQDQPEYTLFWERLDPALRHKSGKIVVCGHTLRPSGWPAGGFFASGIDTGAGHGLWLTCLDVHSGRFWQANGLGDTRRGELPPAF